MGGTFVENLDDVLLRVQRVMDISETNIMSSRTGLSKLTDIPANVPRDATELFRACRTLEQHNNFIQNIINVLSDALVTDFTSGPNGISVQAGNKLHDDVKRVILSGRRQISHNEAVLANLYSSADMSILQGKDIYTLYDKYPSIALALSFPLHSEDRTKLRVKLAHRCVGYTATSPIYYNYMISAKFALQDEIKPGDIRNRSVIFEQGSVIYKRQTAHITSATVESIKESQAIIRSKNTPPKIARMRAGKMVYYKHSIAVNPVYYDGTTYYSTRGVAGEPYMVNNEFAAASSKFFDELVINNDPIVATEFTSVAIIKQKVLDKLDSDTNIDRAMSIFYSTMQEALNDYIRDTDAPREVHDELLLSFIGNLFIKTRQIGKEVKKNSLHMGTRDAMDIAITNIMTPKNNIFNLLEMKRRMY